MNTRMYYPENSGPQRITVIEIRGTNRFAIVQNVVELVQNLERLWRSAERKHTGVSRQKTFIK